MAQFPAKVLPLILTALPWTIGLCWRPTLLAFAFGTVLGALMAWPRSPRALSYLMAPLMTLSAVPYYLLGLILVYLFAVTWTVSALRRLYGGDVPSLTWPICARRAESLGAAGALDRAGRDRLLGARHARHDGHHRGRGLHDHAPRPKGCPAGWIFFRYALRNAILPQVTALALALGPVVSGAVLVEVVFGLPGHRHRCCSRRSPALTIFVIYGIVFIDHRWPSAWRRCCWIWSTRCSIRASRYRAPVSDGAACRVAVEPLAPARGIASALDAALLAPQPDRCSWA